MSYQALADTLGIPEPRSDAELIEITKRGLPADVVKLLADKLEIPASEFARFVHVSARTLSRHKEKPLDCHVSDHIVTISRVYARCIEVFRTRERAVRWLKNPVLALGNTRPLDLLETGTGINMVMNVLGRIEHGVYS